MEIVMRNSLIKRVPRELLKDWPKYLVVIVFMTFMIGVVSGMYVGHDSMVAAIENSKSTGNLEDGNFELEKKLTTSQMKEIENGEMADVRDFLLDKGYEEADEQVEEAAASELEKTVKQNIEDAVRAQCQALGVTDETAIQDAVIKAIEENYDAALSEAEASDDYKNALAEAYDKAHKEVEEKVDEEWDDISEEYELDDANFVKTPVTLYEHFFHNEEEDYNSDGKKDATLRLYRSDSEVDKASFNEGRAPESDDEIAIDRMHAANVGISLGDQITVGDRKYKVVGLLSYVNYVTLHEKNTDLMFDAFGFDVGMVTPEAFDKLPAALHYSYVFMYDKKPANDLEAADFSEDFMKALITRSAVYENDLKDYVPEYLSQAVNFAPSDIEGDTSATGILVYILITVIAFIFAIMVSNTIEKESAVIGTLRASGYTRGELVRHYMTMPVIVTIIGAVIGNLAGYTFFKDIVVDLYYNSYSLPKYVTVWSPSAMVKTTVLPLILMFFINLFVIASKLRLSPLKFLRHDLKKTRRHRAVRLPRWPFLARFRLRVVLQNIPDYLVLIFGVILIEVMLCFAFGFPDSLDHYAETAPEMLFTESQYILTGMKDDDGDVITTKTKGAERFSSATLVQKKQTDYSMRGIGGGLDEDVTIYGYEKNSHYIDIEEELPDGQVYISSAYAKKYGFGKGDKLSLWEKYEKKSYDFTVAGIYDYDGAVAAFMPQENFNRIFDKDKGDFSGYFSDEKIKDIKDKYIATVITRQDITKVTDQLDHSMGGFMKVFQYVLFILAIVLIYLLTKIIIEKNESSISMAKILGFKNRELSSIYMLPTAITVILFTGISFLIGYAIMEELFKIFMMSMDGWFKFYISPKGAVLSMVFMVTGYLVVSLADFRRIRKIPMDEALKNIE
ncbi:MAG: FtsX-like permease family protein [Eubacterium sp.]|nr:FtsX-like permease family protein [Eubacterium sp.]